MAKLSFLKGTTSKRLSLFIQDSSSSAGAGLTGLVFNSAGLTAYYYLEGAASATVISLVTATVGTYTSGGFKEIDATNMPGWYFFCPPNAALTGANSVGIHLKGATNMVPLPLEVELTAWDNQNAVNGGMSALPPTAAGSTGGLSCTTVFGGTATAGSATSITMPAGASAVDNFYNHLEIHTLAGTGSGQIRRIAAYNGTTKVATIGRNWTTNPDNTTVFEVAGPEAMPSWNLFQGLASAGGATTVTLAGGSATSNIYNGALAVIMAGTGARQSRVIVGYNGGTGVVTVDRAWQTNPDSTSVIVILAGDLPGADGAGNLTGSIGSIATGGIVNSSFAVDSITSASLSTGAATEIAGAVWDEARSGHTTAGSFGQGVASVQGNVTGSVGSVTGAVGSVTGAVGSVTGNVGGNVTGSVGSVTGNVGGNVVGSTASVTAAVTVGTINANAINAAAIATDAITAAKIAADAIGASELAADAVTEIQAAVAAGSVASVVGAVGSVTGNVGGNVVGSIGSVATGGIVSGSFAVDSITSASLSTGAATEIAGQVWDVTLSGHLTAGTTGAALSGASSAGDPWSTALPGSYASGTAGFILGTNLDALVSSRLATAGYSAPPSAAAIASQILATTLAELTAASFPATPSVAQALMLPVHMLARGGTMNKTTGVSTYLNNAGAVVLKRTDSDDGVTFTEGALTSGP